jgi:hypothetical protein
MQCFYCRIEAKNLCTIQHVRHPKYFVNLIYSCGQWYVDSNLLLRSITPNFSVITPEAIHINFTTGMGLF